MKIELNMREMLPKIREAFDNKTLQMFCEDAVECLYQGPCAVGVCIPEKHRALCDAPGFLPEPYNATIDKSDSSVGALYNRGYFIIDDDEVEDIIKLQKLHDNCISSFKSMSEEEYKKRIRKFKKNLKKLEKKYGD